MTTETAVNWNDLITEFLSSGMTITDFVKGKEWSGHAFKYHLYKDPRYTPKGRNTNAVALIPIQINEQRSETVCINGFNIDISPTTHDETLAKVLSAIRRIS
jgi:hypothetical protein